MDIDIAEIISHGESQTVEFLTADVSPLVIAKFISAFANTDGGIILLGVKDSETIEGIASGPATLKIADVLGMISSNDVVTFEIKQVRISLEILVIKVEKSEQLVFCDSGAYIRAGEKIKVMPQDKISSRISSSENSVESISQALAKQAQIIETFEKTISELKSEVSNGNSFKSKIKDHFIGGVFGVISGIALGIIGF